jgi:hypothetical protein
MNKTDLEKWYAKIGHSFEQMQSYLDAFLTAYNIAKKLKALQCKSPLDFLVDKLKSFHYIFKDNPFRFFPKQYSYIRYKK